MNEKVIFFVGIIIFAITVYGVVMAGGAVLTKVALDEEPTRPGEAKGGQRASGTLPEKP